MEITINRQITINTGNYSSIRPSVSITMNCDEENLKNYYKKLDNIIDGLFSLEISTLLLSQNSVGSLPIGLLKIAENIESKKEEILDDVNLNLKSI